MTFIADTPCYMVYMGNTRRKGLQYRHPRNVLNPFPNYHEHVCHRKGLVHVGDRVGDHYLEDCCSPALTVMIGSFLFNSLNTATHADYIVDKGLCPVLVSLGK